MHRENGFIKPHPTRYNKMFKKSTALCILAVATAAIFAACQKQTPQKTSAPSNTASRSAASAVSSSTLSAAASSSASSFPAPESDPLYVKAYGYYAADRYDDAISVCNQALAANPNCFWAYNVKGIATYFANGNSAAASCLNLIDKSTTIDPDYSYGYFNKALIQKGLKDWNDSLANFNKVLALKPGDTWSYYGIATVYADTDQTDQALQYLKLAIDTDPSGVKAQVQDDMNRHFSRLKDDPRFQALVGS